ncbi:MAG: hypothetical protein JWL72_1865, partial [Ilumatobacteraceae bacterium]|nr:hypothetical protein [Ilumatobacteraceae bacterium]
EGLTATSSFTVTLSSDFFPLAPARLADTRTGQPTADGLFAGIGTLAAGSTLQLPVAGRGGVAADAGAVALNVTVADTGAPGFVTVFPCGSPQPMASNLNYVAGTTIPNGVISKIGAGGKVCFFTSQDTQLVVDVNGAFPPTSPYQAINPARVLDTRPGMTTIDGAQQATGAAAAGSVTTLHVAGRAGVPADAAAVVLNVTVTEPEASGYATVYPCGATPPKASNLNYTANLTIPNLVVAKVGDGGNVCIFVQTGTQLLADVSGYFPAGSSYAALTPARLLDTRPDQPTVDGLGAGGDTRPAKSVTSVQVTGRGGVPVGATTAVLNVTVTGAAASGYVSVYPCGIDPPLASSLNFVADQTVPNAVIAKIGTDGKVCLYNSQATQLVTDVDGYFP